MYKLRPYQAEAVELGLQFLNDDKKKKKGAILVEPTASGKSLVVCNIAKNLDGKVLVLQPTKEILEQNLQKAEDYGFTDTGVFSASCGRKDFGKITFATIGSVIRKKELFADIDYLIIDECHTVNAKKGMYKNLIEFLGVRVLGLTATAYRLHSYEDMRTGERSVVAKFLHRTRPKLFHEILHVTQISEMYDHKFLCPVNYILNDKYSHDDIALNSTGMDFNKEALAKYNENNDVVGVVLESLEKIKPKHVLVFCIFVEEAERLATNLKAKGISAVSISAKTHKKEREQILRDFRSGDIQVVTNVGVLTTGFDFPELDCLVLARPTQSVALYYQMIGRGLRIAENKEILNVVDVCGNVNRFGKVENFEIVEPKKKMHRLKSNASYLTGYDFVGNKDLESTDYDGKRETTGQDNNKILHFGKYKGKHIARVPTAYLVWCAKCFNGPMKIKFDMELERRKLNDKEKNFQKKLPTV